MKIEICLDEIKPINLNNCYTISNLGGKTRRFPSAEYKKFESIVNLKLRQYKNDFYKFNKYFDENKHYIVAEYVFYYPIMTKEKRLNKRSGDLSNLVKALEDIVFKHFMGIDDSQVTSLYVHKIQSKNIRTEITFTIKDLHHIN